MGLETATYINGLVVTNPASGDVVSQGDDHIRLIKSALKNTFPNITGAVTATHTELNYVDGVTSNIQAQLNTLDAALDTKLNLSGGTLTNFLTLHAAPTSNLHASTKKYVDDNHALALLKAGGTMTGPLTLSGAPTVDLHASTKKYVDDTVAAAVDQQYKFTFLDFGSNVGAASKQYVAHGLNLTTHEILSIQGMFECVAGNNGYSIGDKITINSFTFYSSGPYTMMFQFTHNATYLFAMSQTDGTHNSLIPKPTYPSSAETALVDLNTAQWKYVALVTYKAR